jgi:hypothetical protein
MNGRMMLGIIGIFCSCGLAIADCDTRDFDRTPPAAIRSDVDNQFARFQWATDGDLLAGQSWLWHYIWNRSPNAGLGAIWDKAGIRFPLTNPLPPGNKFCNRKFVAAIRTLPDVDAPIIYGTNKQRQDAVVYVEDQAASQSSASIFETAYLDQQGKKVDVHVGVFSERMAAGYSFQLNIVPDLTVAISRLSKVLSSSELESIVSSAASQRANVRSETLGASGREPVGLNELFSPPELAARLNQNYLFFRVAEKALFRVETPAVEKINAEIVVLDKDAHVIFVGDVEMLAPRR